MNLNVARFLSLSLLACLCVSVRTEKATAAQSGAADTSQKITIQHKGEFPSVQGAADRFTGQVRLDTLGAPAPPSLTRVQSITFAPGAHTAWHSHPLGQTLIVTSGSGYVQQWGGPRQEIHEGDVIWTPPNVKHWHGAGPNGPLTHISVYDEPDGQVTKWMEKVTDEQYKGGR